MTKEKKAYEWDFSGACAPVGGKVSASCETFSLGIFQWIPKASKKGLKRGKVVKRIKGYNHSPQMAYGKAETLVKELNETQFGDRVTPCRGCNVIQDVDGAHADGCPRMPVIKGGKF